METVEEKVEPHIVRRKTPTLIAPPSDVEFQQPNQGSGTRKPRSTHRSHSSRVLNLYWYFYQVPFSFALAQRLLFDFVGARKDEYRVTSTSVNLWAIGQTWSYL